MPNAVIAIAIFASALCTAALTLQPIRKFAERLGLYDLPGPRRVHTYPVPRIGGLAIYLGFLLAVGISLVLPVDRFADEVERITLLIIGATIIVMTMFFDDVVGIRPLPKLSIQIGVGLLVILPRLQGEQSGIIIERFNLPLYGEIKLPLAIAILFTLFWIVGMMNALNWSDGLDGLASSIALAATAILFLHTYFWPRDNPQFTISLLTLAFAGAILGFLPFNWHPAKIIMGDTGAMFLGFVLATISIIGGAKIATALLALGVPIVDMAWVIIFRTLNRRSPMAADRGHLHHRLLDAGLSQQQIVAGYALIALVFGIIGLLLPNRELKFVALIVLGIVVVSVVSWLARRDIPVPEFDNSIQN